MDVMDNKTGVSVSMSHVAARQEVRDLLKTLNIPFINKCLFEREHGDTEPHVAPKPATSQVASATLRLRRLLASFCDVCPSRPWYLISGAFAFWVALG